MSLIWLLPLAALLGWAVWFTARKAKKGGGCCGDREETVCKTSVKDRSRAHYPYAIQLEIGGMTCENCARRVENALNALDGVWAKVSISSHSARVLCKTPPDEASLRQAVQQAGYVVTRVQRTNE